MVIMDEQRDKPEANVEGFGTAMGWWGIDANQLVENRIQRFQQFASSLHRAYSQACEGQFEALTLANECVTRSVQELLGVRRPEELFAAETEVLSGLMKATSLQMKTWTDFTQNIQGCYMDVVRETTNDLGREAREVASEVEQQVEQNVQATKQRTRRNPKGADDQSSANERELRDRLLASTSTTP